MPLSYLRELAQYWAEEYDWRAAESRLNRYPQFRTTLDGASVHFLHVRSRHPEARPLLLTHGWPGGVAEFLEVIDPLTDPTAHGGSPQDAFHLVIPALPGYGFSSPLPGPGWDVARVAGAWAQLMSELGYSRYLVQGGDAGSVVSLALGALATEHVAGVHVNMLMTFPGPDSPPPISLDDRDRARLDGLARFDQELSGYLKVQATRPQTLAYALTDSPVGQLAWIVERFKDWTDSAKVPEDAVDRDLMLTIVTMYWLTATAGSSAQFYFEGAEGMRQVVAGASPPPVTAPIAVAVFPKDIFLPIRRIAQHQYPSISRWTEFEAGGHFAAMEQPESLVADLRAFHRELR